MKILIVLAACFANGLSSQSANRLKQLRLCLELLAMEQNLTPLVQYLLAIPVLANSAIAIQKLATELDLTPEELRTGLSNFVKEAERRCPQILTGLFIIALLPVLASRTFRYFRYTRSETYQDSQDLSQSFVLKTLATLAGPHGNIGAWLSEIRENLYKDHLRKRDCRRTAMTRIEKAYKGLCG
jgi:hypothetical protein